MPQPIALGTVLGGRYQVTASLMSSARGDHVLQGDDLILHRRVSIVIPDPVHEQVLIDNARKLASEPEIDHFQVLDLGQTEEGTYLVTSYAPAKDLLHLLLDGAEHHHDDDSLSDDIFGGPRTAPLSAYLYDESDPTRDHETVGTETGEHASPAVMRWDEDDYSAYEDAPAAPSVRNRLGQVRKVRRNGTRATVFDRAAAGGSSAAVGASAAAASKIDPTYDGDNRYEDLPEDENRPEDFTGYPVIDDETPGQTGSAAAAAVAASGAGNGGEDPEPDHRSPGSSPAATDAYDDDDEPKSRAPLVALFLVGLTALLLAAVFFGFQSLSSLTSQFGAERPAPQAGGTPAASQQPTDPAAAAQPAPEVQSVTRVSSDPTFMADTDATLGQAIDANPATYWLSYGFANTSFGGLVENIGLAMQLEQPAPVSEVVIDQSGGTGGSFTVYVSDSPTVEGAQQVGSGSFTGPQITVPLDEAARAEPHQYVLVVWDQLPQLTEPIGGYSNGLRIGEVAVR